MIWYKKQYQVFESWRWQEDLHFVNRCMRKKITGMFLNEAPQRKIEKDLHVTASMVCNIIKRFSESEEISVHKRQMCKAQSFFFTNGS